MVGRDRRGWRRLLQLRGLALWVVPIVGDNGFGDRGRRRLSWARRLWWSWVMIYNKLKYIKIKKKQKYKDMICLLGRKEVEIIKKKFFIFFEKTKNYFPLFCLLDGWTNLKFHPSTDYFSFFSFFFCSNRVENLFLLFKFFI